MYVIYFFVVICEFLQKYLLRQDDVMSFKDIIKKSFLEGFDSGNLSTAGIIIALAMAVALGLFIYFIYRVTSKSAFYNRSFNKSLATLPVITAGIMLAMQSNLVISLGMVGALSIVRFRNAVKDAADLTFLFWSISVGIITGAGLYELALILSLAVTALVFLLDLIPTFRAPCILVVSGEDAASEKDLLDTVKKHAKTLRVRSRSITKRGVEWILELRVKEEAALVQAVSQVKGIGSVNLMSHDGDLRI